MQAFYPVGTVVAYGSFLQPVAYDWLSRRWHRFYSNRLFS